MLRRPHSISRGAGFDCLLYGCVLREYQREGDSEAVDDKLCDAEGERLDSIRFVERLANSSRKGSHYGADCGVIESRNVDIETGSHHRRRSIVTVW